MDLFTKQKQNHRCKKQTYINKTKQNKTNLWLPGGKGGEKDKLGDWD